MEAVNGYTHDDVVEGSKVSRYFQLPGIDSGYIKTFRILKGPLGCSFTGSTTSGTYTTYLGLVPDVWYRSRPYFRLCPRPRIQSEGCRLKIVYKVYIAPVRLTVVLIWIFRRNFFLRLWCLVSFSPDTTFILGYMMEPSTYYRSCKSLSSASRMRNG